MKKDEDIENIKDIGFLKGEIKAMNYTVKDVKLDTKETRLDVKDIKEKIESLSIDIIRIANEQENIKNYVSENRKKIRDVKGELEERITKIELKLDRRISENATQINKLYSVLDKGTGAGWIINRAIPAGGIAALLYAILRQLIS